MLKPDISIAHRNRPSELLHIIDTKYKILDSEQSKFGISQADMYQMYAYANRYKTKHITLLYPLRNEQEIEEKTYLVEDECEISIRTIDLRGDLKKTLPSIKSELLTGLSLESLL